MSELKQNHKEKKTWELMSQTEESKRHIKGYTTPTKKNAF